jgi:hypothetical protein
VIVAVAGAGVVQVTIDQVVGVVAMGHGLVSAAGAVHMSFFMAVAVVPWGADGGIAAADGDAMLLDPTLAGVVQVAVVQVIGVSFVLDGGVAAVGTMSVSMTVVSFLSCHRNPRQRNLRSR